MIIKTSKRDPRKDITKNFEKWVDERPWFVEVLQAKEIDYWNFNGFLFENWKPLICIRKEDLSLWKDYQVIKEKDNLCLIEERQC